MRHLPSHCVHRGGSSCRSVEAGQIFKAYLRARDPLFLYSFFPSLLLVLFICSDCCTRAPLVLLELTVVHTDLVDGRGSMVRFHVLFVVFLSLVCLGHDVFFLHQP